MTAQEIAALVTDPGESRDIQLIQTEYRTQVRDAWEPLNGLNILEVGCGQGDMTAVLADAVGPSGHVTAVDSAPATYGAPMTLQQATERIKATPLGKRIDFCFEFDILSQEPQPFDLAVLTHCSWYFQSRAQIRQVLKALTSWAPRLAFAEWDLGANHMDQVPHLLAALIQGQANSFDQNASANIRTPFSHAELRTMLIESGWTETKWTALDTSRLQDARWEIDLALNQTNPSEETPQKLKDLLEVQKALLQRISEEHKLRPMPAYAILAERNR